MFWLKIKIRLLTIVAKFLSYFLAPPLWALRFEWSFKLHQKIGWMIIRWYHRYKHIHKMEIWDDYEE